MTQSETSINARAESVMGRRYAEGEKPGLIINHPCEEGYWCPACRVEWDEGLYWSEYRAFLWCPKCNFDWPSAMCVPLDAAPDPERPWRKAGRDAAVKVFLDSVAEAVERARAPLQGSVESGEAT
jgi:hypothetical protein